VGALIAGRPGGMLQRRAFLVPFSLLAIPLIMLMGRVTAVWQLLVLTGILWLGGGCQVTSINIIASRHTAESERGRVFGMIGVAFSASSVVGGMAIGALVDRSGYATMFVVVAGLNLLVPLAFMLLPRVPVERLTAASGSASSARAVPLIGSAAILFLIAQILASTANGAGNLGRSLLMDARGFSASAITSTLVIGSLVTLPVPFVLGWLSDRIGRRSVLITCYACGAASLVLLVVSSALWHFWIVGLLIAVLGISVSIGPAFIADLVPPARVGIAMSLFQAAFYLGSIAGMSALVPATGAIGTPWTLAIAAAVTAASVVLLLFVRRPQPAAPITPP
jgi:MFS family permease